MLHISLKLTFLKGYKKKNDNNNIGRFPGGGLENQNPARTIAHSPPGVKETLNYMLREKKTNLGFLMFFIVLGVLGYQGSSRAPRGSKKINKKKIPKKIEKILP